MQQMLLQVARGIHPLSSTPRRSQYPPMPVRPYLPTTMRARALWVAPSGRSDGP